MGLKFGKIFILLFLVIGTASAGLQIFSKSHLTDSTKTTAVLTKYPFSEKTRSVFPNNVFFRAVAKGIRWGTIGAISGAGLGLLTDDDMGLAPVLFSIIGGSAGFLGGWAWGISNKESRKTLRRNQPKEYRFGYNLEVNSGMANHSPMNEPSIGFFLRWPAKRGWELKPNHIRLYHGTLGASNSTKEKPETASISDKRFGIELLKIRRDHVFNIFYGLGFGYSSGHYFRNDENYILVSKKPESAFFVDLIFGLNLNITDYLWAQLVYKWEPIGIRNAVKNSDNFSPGIHHLIGFSFTTFLF